MSLGYGWWKKNRDRVMEQRKQAEEALIMSRVSYMSMQELNREAERLEKGHRRLQQENHFAEKMYGRFA